MQNQADILKANHLHLQNMVGHTVTLVKSKIFNSSVWIWIKFLDYWQMGKQSKAQRKYYLGKIETLLHNERQGQKQMK